MEEDFPFILDIFEGPLPFLLHLIQKNEINIHDIPIQEIISQYLQRWSLKSTFPMDSGAEFIGIASLLVWIKSKRLLPKHKGEEKEEDIDPQFDILYKILEYCQFKEVAQSFAQQEEEQAAYFTRGVSSSLPEPKKQLGIEHLTQEDLANLFKKVLERASSTKQYIQKESWKISDKIQDIKNILEKEGITPFFQLFSPCRSKEEIIITFLALLELMKSGLCRVDKGEKGGDEVKIVNTSFE